MSQKISGVINKDSNPELILRLEKMLNEAYLSGWDRSTEFTKEIVDAEIYKRFNQAVEFVIPWVNKVAPLDGAVVVEIGCGTGSSTTAFAHHAQWVHGYDINEMHVAGANNRAYAFGLENVSCQAFRPDQLLNEVSYRHGAGVDLVLLYAVLEHCTPFEVIATIRACWKILKPGGHMVVVETPNRLTYMDRHTAMMPFFHMLPARTAVEYSSRSNREDMKVAVKKALLMSEQEAETAIIRLGTGVSFHDFELALEITDLNPYVVCDGYEPEMLIWNPISFEERLLQCFFVYHDLPVPLGFARAVLNLILRKPAENNGSIAKSLISKNDRERYTPDIKDFLRPADYQILKQKFDAIDTTLWLMSPANIHDAHGLHQVEMSFTDEGLNIASLGTDPYIVLPPLDQVLPTSILRVEIESSVSTLFEVFYMTEAAMDYAQARSQRCDIYRGNNVIYMKLPDGVTGRLRIDPGEKQGHFLVSAIEIRA